VLTPLLLAAGSLLTALALLAGWAQWQLLNTDRWADTSADVLKREEVRKRLAQYVVEEVRRSSGGVLPPQVGDRLEPAIENELASPRSERLWRATTTEAHRELVRLIEDDSAGANNVVTLDLRRLIAAISREIGMPIRVPANVGRVTIVAGNQVSGARAAARRLERVATVLLILAPLTLLLAVALARGWRARALAGAGLAVAAAGVLVLLTRSLVGANVVDVLAASAGDRDAVEAVWSAGTSQLATMAGIAIAAGLAVALAAGIAGRSRPRYQ
jgi:hypothetical protein